MPVSRPAARSLQARDFGFTYRGSSAPALQGVEIDLAAGECLLVVGPSGSGKSTLGLAVAGLVPRDLPGDVVGSLLVDGRETRAFAAGELAATVGLVFQDPAVQLVMDLAGDDVAFGLENRSWPIGRMRLAVPAALAAVGLAGMERRHAAELSGGQQQRLALSGVLAAEPGILVLDEPTANLDPGGAAAFLERIAELRANRAATIVLIDHRLEGAWSLADRVLALGADGRPIASGTPEEVLREAALPMAAAGIRLPGEVGTPGRASGGSSSHSGAPPLLAANGLAYGYAPGSTAIRDVQFAAAAGERIALVGPNGGGKSTLGRLLVGLLRPRRGTVRLDGRDPAALDPATLARLAGYVFQRPEQQFLAQRVVDEVTLGLRPEERSAAGDVMERLGLPLASFGERSPYLLSGGEQRRLALACVLIRRPGVLVLDEPTFGQDRHGYQALLDIVREMVGAGTCLIVATHDLRLVEDVADRIVTLDDGRIVGDVPAPRDPRR